MILQYLTYSLVSYSHLSCFQFVNVRISYIVMVTTQLLKSLILLTRLVTVQYCTYPNIHKKIVKVISIQEFHPIIDEREVESSPIQNSNSQKACPRSEIFGQTNQQKINHLRQSVKPYLLIIMVPRFEEMQDSTAQRYSR